MKLKKGGGYMYIYMYKWGGGGGLELITIFDGGACRGKIFGQNAILISFVQIDFCSTKVELFF